MWLGSHDIQLWAILSFQVEGAFDVGSQTLSKLGAAAGTAHLPPQVLQSHLSKVGCSKRILSSTLIWELWFPPFLWHPVTF